MAGIWAYASARAGSFTRYLEQDHRRVAWGHLGAAYACSRPRAWAGI